MNTDFLRKYYLSPNSMYCDEKSVEENTGIMKRKYKLFFGFQNLFDEVLIFLVSTTNKDAVSNQLCFTVESHEWENLVDKKFLKETSIIDVRKTCYENIDEVFSKWSCTPKDFFVVATLPTNKHLDVANCFNNLPKRWEFLSPKEKKDTKVISSLLFEIGCLDDNVKTVVDKLMVA